MQGGYPNNLQQSKGSGIYIGAKELLFPVILCTIGLTLYLSLISLTSAPLVLLTVPLVLYDRAFMYPMLMTISLSQGAFTDTATSGVGTADASYAESLTIAAITPILAWDLLTQKSKIVPLRFSIIYLFFIVFVITGIFVYYQHPQNFAGLPAGTGKAAPAFHSIVKAIKLVFYLFFLRVLINYPEEILHKIPEYTRRCMPFIIIPLGLNLLLNGRVQSGVGYSGTLQLGDVHHGTFTSTLCALSIYVFITLFSRKPGVGLFTRFFAFGTIALVGVMIMMMGSRNGLLSFMILCCLGVYIHLVRRTIDYQFVIVSVCFAGAVIALLLSLNSPTLQRAVYMTDQAGGGDRTYYWEAGAHALSASPVFGMGGDETASIAAVARYAPSMVQDRVMHNTYLEAAVEYGLVAAVLYIAFVWFTLQWSYRLYKLALNRQEIVLAAPGLSYLIMMIAAMFVSNLWDTSIWYTVSIIFALAIRLVYPQWSDKRRIHTRLSFEQMKATAKLGSL
ncbi:O-antigen ligase family protein [Parafilimonas sp.]|uniref:O-antigen ligase family protein n=1 Tax=Parafilimonas sp. TaxID=1969739 RepID=UPI0039E43F62